MWPTCSLSIIEFRYCHAVRREIHESCSGSGEEQNRRFKSTYIGASFSRFSTTYFSSYAELDHSATVIWSSSRSRIFWSFFDSALVAKNRAPEGVKLYPKDPGNAHHLWANFWAPALNLKRHQKCKQNHQKTRGHAHKICLVSGPGQITVAFWSTLCKRASYHRLIS